MDDPPGAVTPCGSRDVFARETYTGNRLLTLLRCGDLSADAMQAIAREIG